MKELLHVSVVVVDGGAAYSCVTGDVRHGQAGEAMGEEELTEGSENPPLGLGALGSICGGRDPGHIDTLQ